MLESNSTRVQSDIFNRVEESRSRLEFEIRRLLHEISRVAEQALTRARSARAEGTEAIRGALARLDEVESEIRDCRPTPPKVSRLSCRTGCGLGCGWHFGDLGVLERDDLPPVLFLYDDQRRTGLYLARFVAFLELHLASGEYHRDVGAQKADAP